MVLEGLYIYPIKSTHRVSQLRSRVELWGLASDRRWMMINEEGIFLSQREFPRMSLIQAVPRENNELFLTAMGQRPITVEIPKKEAADLRVSIWGDLVPAQIASHRVNVWLSDFLGRTVRLVYMDDPNTRMANSTFAKPGTTISFSDGYPLLCTTSASLRELNEKSPTPVPMERFRPNVVISGGQPFDEDHWKRLRIGEVTFAVVKPCARCVITTVDQNTAVQGKEPLRTLSSFRKRNGKVLFGENLVPENTGVIRRGDEVEVLEFEYS
ncbi:MAG: MOSC domain-containing protein [Bacteroidetes bacterium]|nr:MOSC domain-containing protein [Bacteroidota bacterium]